jgi:hypothetical protein
MYTSELVTKFHITLQDLLGSVCSIEIWRDVHGDRSGTAGLRVWGGASPVCRIFFFFM